MRKYRASLDPLKLYTLEGTRVCSRLSTQYCTSSCTDLAFPSRQLLIVYCSACNQRQDFGSPHHRRRSIAGTLGDIAAEVL